MKTTNRFNKKSNLKSKFCRKKETTTKLKETNDKNFSKN